jgi:hypothetical protein
MGMFYIYRVFRKNARCVYGRRFIHDAGPFPAALDDLFRRQIIIPKALAPNVAPMIAPFSDEIAKIIEAYPESYHHAAQPEIGIGLALSPEKWEDGWPCIEFEELSWIEQILADHPLDDWSYATVKHEWTIQQLLDRRNAGLSMPRGMDKEAWRILGAAARAKSKERRLRAK